MDAAAAPVAGGAAPDDPAATAAIAFARLAGRLKTTPRTGWVRRGVPRYESVADHSWRVAALALLAGDRRGRPEQDEDDHGVDVARCMQLAVVHDLAESIIGDIPPDDNVSDEEKLRMEQEAEKTITAILGRVDAGTDTGAHDETTRESYLTELFREYETRQSKEAKIVKDLDLLDMIIQADEYEERFGTDLSDFFDNTKPTRFMDPFLRRVAEQVHAQRAARIKRYPEAMPEKLGASELSRKDQAFVDEYSQASRLDKAELERIIQAFRAFEKR